MFNFFKRLWIKMTTPKISPIPAIDSANAPLWVKWFLDRLGWTEYDHDKELSQYWKETGLDYSTVIGGTHAWCGMSMFEAMHTAGVKGPEQAYAASSWSNWGESCDYITGAVLPIRHSSGGRHVCLFLYWVDEKKRIAACLGGNQSDAIRISNYCIAGNAVGCDEVVPNPRWPSGVAKTGFSMTGAGGSSEAKTT